MLRKLFFTFLLFISVLQISSNDTKVEVFTCEFLKDVSLKSSDVKVVTIAIFKHTFHSSLIDNVLKCMQSEFSAFIVDFSIEKSMELQLKKSSIVVMLADDINYIKFFKILKSSTLNYMANFLILTSTNETKISKTAANIFPKLGVFNFAIIHSQNASIFTTISNHFFNTSSTLKLKPFMANLFPDKLTNLNGYNYRITVHHLMSYTVIDEKYLEFFAKNRYLIDAICQLQGAKADYKILKSLDAFDILRQMEVLINNRQIDLTLSEPIKMSLGGGRVMTFEEKALCAAVPYGRSQKEVRNAFMKNDEWLFGIFGWTILSIALIWRLYRDKGAVESHWKILFVLFKFLHGQSSQISRKNRKILLFMMQIIIFMMLVVNTIYQGFITSIEISKNNRGRKIQSIDEILVRDDLKIVAGPVVDTFMGTNEHYQAKKAKGKVKFMSKYGMGSEYLNQYLNLIVLGRCDLVDHFLYATPTHYLVPQNIYPTFMSLDVGHLNPFIEKIQIISHRAFDSGLTIAWKNFFMMEMFKTPKANSSINLDVDEILVAFIIKLLAISYSFCVFVFLLEIFYNNLLWSFSKLLSKVNKSERMKRICSYLTFRSRKARVQVRPIDI